MRVRIYEFSLFVIVILNAVFFTELLSAQTESVTVTVDANARQGTLKHVWQYFGYDGDKVKILLWNYHDLLAPAPSASIQLRTTLPDGLPSKAQITHYRIDDEHSNAYTKWLELGSPQNPDEDMIDQLNVAMQLQMLEPVKMVDVNDHEVTLNFDLPRFGLSLIIIEPAVKNAAQ